MYSFFSTKTDTAPKVNTKASKNQPLLSEPTSTASQQGVELKTVALTTLEAVDTSKTTTTKNPKAVAKVTGISPPIMDASDDANMIPLKHNESHTTKLDADTLKKAVETASKKINVPSKPAPVQFEKPQTRYANKAKGVTTLESVDTSTTTVKETVVAAKGILEAIEDTKKINYLPSAIDY